MTLVSKSFKFLTTPVDNISLVIFRIIFGFLITAEAWGAILTGWVGRTFIEPAYNFPFISFSFLEPLPGNGMYYYFILMGSAGIFVMIGYKYRYAMITYALLWSGAYLMQKTSYNNHYYLLMLLCWIMCLVPANANYSVDARINENLRSNTTARWHILIFIVQISVVYFYASVAKMYPDWIRGMPVRIFFSSKENYFLVGQLLQKDWMIYAVSYGGILFDLLIVPGLLWKKTRKLAFGISIFFHLFNSAIFQVGIFPYLGIAFGIFFFDSDTVRKFFKRKPYKPGQLKLSPMYQKLILSMLGIYFIIQLLLPLRHWFFPGVVHWTEEGHRLSWHMMLRSKSGFVNFRVKTDSAEWITSPGKYLTAKQSGKIATHPDMLWQFVQILKDDLEAHGIQNAEIYAQGKASLNGRQLQPLYDPDVDMAKIEWEPFRHSSWLLPLED
ncbi:MAG: HTTM domain-containing protein [Cyclobacteriaceae bacterium]